ncbi:MAG TPA: HEAT repeat domain-containing protein [Vicinamibacterales bacterium]|nr:HEAT repeat domain-containing protein [Vicinamibacterales bacterium]
MSSGRFLIPARRCARAAAVLVVAAAGCATPPPPAPPAVPYEQKVAWILQLEDQRLLELKPPAPPPVETPPPRGRRRAPATTPPPSSSPDLSVLVRDPDPRVRRRAALAIGRVKLDEGVKPLLATLADSDAEVRAMACFALGLIGAGTAEAELAPLLADSEPLVRGRAAEALGSIGARGAADAIGRLVAEYSRSPAVAAIAPDDDAWPAAGEAEAFKLGLFALVRLRAYEALAAAVLNGNEVITSWWPVAYALQRVEDPRAAPALLYLLGTPGRYTRGFAARGLGAYKHGPAVKPLLALLDPAAGSGLELTVAAVRALAQIGAPDAVEPLMRLAAGRGTQPMVRLEAVIALGDLGNPRALPVLQDLLTDEWPALRAAALSSAASVDEEAFGLVLSGMEPDRHWRVRAALATALGNLPAESVLDRLRFMLADDDKRVIPPVLSSLTRLKAPEAAKVLAERLEDPDFGVRAAAARELGRLKPPGGAELLRKAYEIARPDSAYAARTAALEALVEYGAGDALDTVRLALEDKDWAVRVRAAELMRKLEPATEVAPLIRPAPAGGGPAARYDDPQLIAPEYSPHVFIETAHGTIEFQLAVLDAPQTAWNFVALARKGFFNGLEVHRVVPNFVVQDGDPRGDGSGGPGYTIRDELNERPFVRGTVGMALAWPDSGGSQFFIMHSPAPHLDARYTAFGHVVNGMEVVDRIRQGDVIQRVRVWDGRAWQ